MGNAITIHVSVYVIMLATQPSSIVLVQHSFGSREDMAIWEWVLRSSSAGDLTLLVTEDLKLANAPP